MPLPFNYHDIISASQDLVLKNRTPRSCPPALHPPASALATAAPSWRAGASSQWLEWASCYIVKNSASWNACTMEFGAHCYKHFFWEPVIKHLPAYHCYSSSLSSTFSMKLTSSAHGCGHGDADTQPSYHRGMWTGRWICGIPPLLLLFLTPNQSLVLLFLM